MPKLVAKPLPNSNGNMVLETKFLWLENLSSQLAQQVPHWAAQVD